MIHVFASPSAHWSVVVAHARSFAEERGLPLYIQPFGLPHNEEANDAEVAISKADERGVVYACQEIPILRFSRLIEYGEIKNTEIEVYNISKNFPQRLTFDKDGDFREVWFDGYFEARYNELFGYRLAPVLRTIMSSNLKSVLDSLQVVLAFKHTRVDTDTGDPYDVWMATITRGDKSQTFEYRTGLGHRKLPYDWRRENGSRKPRQKEMLGFPTILNDKFEKESLIESIINETSYAEMFYEDMCSDFGYDPDSRSHLDTYLLMQKNAIKLRKVFTYDDLNRIRQAIERDNDG